MDKECLICFCPIEDQVFTCADNRCQGTTCGICTEALIKFSANEKVLPKCPEKDCHSFYILSGLAGLTQEIIQKYAQTCLDFFLKDQGDVVQKQLQEIQILAQLREERKKFIDTNYPAGIALVASITFTNKLRRLEKQKSIILHKQMLQAHRACMNSTCGGFLDKNLVCMTCQTEFCRFCEKKLVSGHKCKQEDLDSVNLVNNMIKCPGCKLPVFKNEGCDSITCSNCGTKFLYSTGKEGGHGSSNAKIVVDMQQRYKLSHSYANQIPKECMEKLLTFEAIEPKTISKDTLLTPIRNYFKSIKPQNSNDNSDHSNNGSDHSNDDLNNQNNSKDDVNQMQIARQMAQKIDAYYRNRFLNREYQKFLVEIEDILKLSNFTKEQLSDKLEKCLKEIGLMKKVKVPSIILPKTKK